LVGRRGRASITALAVGLAALAAGCGGDDKTIGDQRILDGVKLEESESGDGYQLASDPFCVVEKELLNDASEVEDAFDDEDELVVASDEGNVGVIGAFVPRGHCGKVLRKRLNKLDPAPKEG
jgi:hypothetical protein